MKTTSRLVLFHTMDPRGDKLGGIETHVRLMLARHPPGVDLVFVGIDERGDLPIGQSVRISHEDRVITFLPVARIGVEAINKAAKKVWQSTTLRYTLGLLKHLPALRRAVRGLPASAEVERFEYAFVARLLRLPLVVLVHNEGTREDAMDSLLKRYWYLHLFNERLALEFARRIFAVNPAIATRIGHLSPRLAARTEIMSVSVDTARFSPTPFNLSDDAFHVCFAGRLDAFKDPPLMFATLARLAEQLARDTAGPFRRLVFDYVGASDPTTMEGFAPIAAYTVRHGPKKAVEVAALMRDAHAGLITSFFEGLPCYLLEMLATGRPVVAVALPQFAPLIVPDVSGTLIPRAAMPAETAAQLAEGLMRFARRLGNGELVPATIAEKVAPYSVEAQLHRLFRCHEGLALGAGAQPPYGSESISSA